jgi:hypothetical protein
MKRQIFLLILLVSGIVVAVQGQEDKKPKMKVTSTGFSFGFAGALTANTTEDYLNLRNSVNDPELFINPDEYNYSSYNFGAGGNVSPKIYLGLTPYSKKKGEYRNNRELRLSIGFTSGIRRNFNFYRYNNFVVDTFKSVSNGEVVYSDSSIYDNFLYSENFTDINFGIAYLFKTPVERRFHFSAGVGLEYGIAMRSFVRVDNYNEKSMYYYNSYNKPEFNEDKYNFYSYGSDDNGTTYTEKTNMKGALQFVRFQLPLSVNFRIANKQQSFFNQVYLFIEASPGLEMQIVSGDKTYVNPYFGFAWIGVSYRW